MNQDILKILLQRQADGYVSGSCSDGHKLALFLPGGGLVNVRNAAMASALEQAGLTKYFDIVAGTSGGAAISGLVVSEQAHAVTSTFYHDNFSVESPNGVGPTGLDVGKVYNQILPNPPYAFNADKIIHKQNRDKQKLLVTVADIESGDGYLFGEFLNAQQVFEGMHASSQMDETKPPIELEDRDGNRKQVVDGGHADGAIPIRCLEEDFECTHILMLDSYINSELDPTYIPQGWANYPELAEARSKSVKHSNEGRQRIIENSNHLLIQTSMEAPQTPLWTQAQIDAIYQHGLEVMIDKIAEAQKDFEANSLTH